MGKLKDEIVRFFQNQHFAIVATVDPNGSLHNSCKGIIQINQNGRVYLLDLYREKTFTNLKKNPNISITAVDEHKFRGYCLKGVAKIIKGDRLNPSVIKAWENKISGRITHRVLRNIHGEKGHPRHPEVLLPKPEYMILVEVKEVVNLTPRHISDDIIYGAKRT